MKKYVAKLLAISLLLCLIATPVSAERSNKKTITNHSGVITKLNSNEEMSLFSTMPYKGPLKGATKSGSVKKMSSHENLSTKQKLLHL